MAEAHTVEALNPRGKVVSETRMAIKRSRALARICEEAVATAGTLHEACEATPGTLGISSTALKFVFGDPWYASPLAREWWPWVLNHWYHGGLERVERQALQNLPEATREKLHVT